MKDSAVRAPLPAILRQVEMDRSHRFGERDLDGLLQGFDDSAFAQLVFFHQTASTQNQYPATRHFADPLEHYGHHRNIGPETACLELTWNVAD